MLNKILIKFLIALFAASLFFLTACEKAGRSHDFETSISIEKPTFDKSPYTYVPFEVPPNTKSISIGYEYEKDKGKNRIEFGVFDSGFSGKPSDKKGFRGWSGSVRDKVFIAEDSATNGYKSGEIEPGAWRIILGAAEVEDYVDVKVFVDFNKVDEDARRQFEEESVRKFPIKKHEKVERLKTGELTWFAGDLHAHTVHSDGRWTVKGVLDSASANNLDFVSITAHNTFTHHREIETVKPEYPELTVINGEEVTTYGGHINVWGLPKNEWMDFRVFPSDKKSGAKIAKKAAGFGALASINHPKMDCGGCAWGYGEWDEIGAVEVWNAKWDEQDDVALTKWDDLLLNQKKVTGIASSDSHQHPSEPSDYPTNLAIGSPTVFVGAKENTTEAILEGIRKGKVFAAENSRRRMMLTANKISTIGDTVEAKHGDVIEFKYSVEGFENGSKLRIIANAQIAKEFLIYEEKYGGDYKIYATQDGYVRLEVRDHRDQLIGFTNPIQFVVKR